MTDTELEVEIAYRAEADGLFAIAHAIMQLAEKVGAVADNMDAMVQFGLGKD